MTFEGTTDKEVFEAYVARFLAPALCPGQVVVLDNLGAHKGERIRDLVESRGASLLFLPAYSPDFSPIEEALSKIKTLLKKEAARTREALVEAIGRALDAVTPEDAKGWFVHCGYEVEAQRALANTVFRTVLLPPRFRRASRKSSGCVSRVPWARNESQRPRPP
jgi:transposase